MSQIITRKYSTFPGHALSLATEKEKFKLLGPPGNIKMIDTCKIEMKLKVSFKLGYNTTSHQVQIFLFPHVKAIYSKLAKLDRRLIVESGMDITGGSYNLRVIRGTENRKSPPWSSHAWGIAIDHDPVRNGLHTKAPKANLSSPDYNDIHEIWAQHGFLNIGHVIGRDFMHYEASFELLSNPSKFL